MPAGCLVPGAVTADLKKVTEDRLDSGVTEHVYRLLLRGGNTRTGGINQAGFTLIAANGTSSDERSVAVNWYIKSLFTIEPAEINFGYIPDDIESVERACTIRRTDGEPLEIVDSSLDLEGASIDAKSATPSLLEAQVIARIAPAKLHGSFRRQLVLRTNHPQQPTVNIWVSGVH